MAVPQRLIWLEGGVPLCFFLLISCFWVVLGETIWSSRGGVRSLACKACFQPMELVLWSTSWPWGWPGGMFKGPCRATCSSFSLLAATALAVLALAAMAQWSITNNWPRVHLQSASGRHLRTSFLFPVQNSLFDKASLLLSFLPCV